MNSDPDVPWWLGLHPVQRPHPDELKLHEALELMRLFAELGPENRRKLIHKVEVGADPGRRLRTKDARLIMRLLQRCQLLPDFIDIGLGFDDRDTAVAT